MPKHPEDLWRTALAILAKYGLGTLLALYLVWFLTTGLTRSVDALSATLRAQSALDVSRNADIERATVAIQFLCVSSVKSDEDKLMCLGLKPGR